MDISYHNRNTPQLIPAIELDRIIQSVSTQLASIQTTITSECDIDYVIEQIRNKLTRARFEEYWLLNEQILIHDLSPSFSITQLVVDPHVHVIQQEELHQAIRSCLIESRIGHRFPLSVDIVRFSSILSSHTILLSSLRSAVQTINHDLREHIIRPTIISILQSLRNTIRYRFLTESAISHPPSPTRQYPLVEPYFTPIQSGITQDKSARTDCTFWYNALVSVDEWDQQILHSPVPSSSTETNSNKITIYCANNGWTWNNHPDPLHLHRVQQYNKNSSSSSSSSQSPFSDGFIINTPYLLREVVIWSDCVKLRYYHNIPTNTSSIPFDHLHNQQSSEICDDIDKVADSPSTNSSNATWILHVMQTYLQVSAFLFDGIRLDNCHNTPISLLEDLIPHARTVRPSLLLLAELFTSNQHTDVEYVRRIGIDMILREVSTIPSIKTDNNNINNDNNINNNDDDIVKEVQHRQEKAFGDLLYASGGEDLGTLQAITEVPRYITNTRLPVVLFDLTHDNQSYLQHYRLETIPSVTVMAGMAVAHVASTRGHDVAFFTNPSVTEQRLYEDLNTDIAQWSDQELHELRNSLLLCSSSSSSLVNLPGNIKLRLLMNSLHQLLSQQSFSERYVHVHTQFHSISIERRQTGSNYSVFTLTRLAFSKSSSHSSPSSQAFEISVLGRVEGVFVSVTMKEELLTPNSILHSQRNDQKILHGTPFQVDLLTDRPHAFLSIQPQGDQTLLRFSSYFSPGSSVVLLLYNGTASPPSSTLLNYQQCKKTIVLIPCVAC